MTTNPCKKFNGCTLLAQSTCFSNKAITPDASDHEQERLLTQSNKEHKRTHIYGETVRAPVPLWAILVTCTPCHHTSKSCPVEAVAKPLMLKTVDALVASNSRLRTSEPTREKYTAEAKLHIPRELTMRRPLPPQLQGQPPLHLASLPSA